VLCGTDKSTAPDRREDREKLAQKQPRRPKSTGLAGRLENDTSAIWAMSRTSKKLQQRGGGEMAVRLYSAAVNLTLTHVSLQQAAS